MNRLSKFATAALLLLGNAAVEANQQCYGLALSGGGALGSYEAGALYGMYHGSSDKSKFEYEVASGVSAGAINSFAISLFEKGQEGAMVDFLTK